MTQVPTNVAVLVSGRGSNLDALARAAAKKAFPARIAIVVSNRRSAPALALARDRGLATLAMPQSEHGNDPVARDRAMLGVLRDNQVRLVVCAGYDRILSEEVLAAYDDAILNVHPSLLPAFGGGMHAIEEALAAGVKVTGCTVQLLEPGVADGGPIVLQEPVPVLDDDDAESLRARVHEAEWRLLPSAVELWCTGRLQREGRRVRIVDAPGSRSVKGAA